MNDYSQAVCVPGSAIRASGRRERTVPLSASLLLPSFGAIVFIVTLMQVLFLSHGAQGLFRDSDTGWHIRNGANILAARSVPQADSFSYTRNGAQWFAWEWLPDVAFAEAYQAGGLTAVTLLTAVVIAMVVWLAVRFCLFLGGNLFMTAAATVVMLGATSIHWLARPHIFSWLLSLAVLWIAEHERRQPGRFLYVVPLIAGIWANVHGSFLLAAGILVVYAAGECARGRLNGALRFLIAAVASIGATFINPYGWRLHAHVYTYLTNSYLMDHIAEFRSFSFHMQGAIYVEMFLVIALTGTLLLVKQKAYGPALLAAAMLHLSLYSARHIPTAAILLLPLCVAAFTREAGEWPALRSFFRYSGRLQSIDERIFGVVPVAVVLVIALIGANALARSGHIGFDPSEFPIGAAGFLDRQNVEGRIFTKDHWGGYLIYRFAGRKKVFLDGRSDFYGQTMLETYSRVVDVKPGWDEILKQYDVRLVLIPQDQALASALKLSPGWKQVYSDPVARVFERSGL